MKDDILFGTSHSSMATREGLLCSNLSFLTSLRLLTLTHKMRLFSVGNTHSVKDCLFLYKFTCGWSTWFPLLFSGRCEPREQHYSEVPCCSAVRHPETYQSTTPEQTHSQLDDPTSHFWFHLAAISWRPKILSLFMRCCSVPKLIEDCVNTFSVEYWFPASQPDLR